MDETEASVWDLCQALHYLLSRPDWVPAGDRSVELRRLVKTLYNDMMTAEVLVLEDEGAVIVEELQPKVFELRGRPDWRTFFPQIDALSLQDLLYGFVIKQRFDIRNPVLKDMVVRLANWAAAPQGIQIRPSTIPQAGYGLFATRDFFNRRMLVTTYGGLTSNENASEGLPPPEQSAYVIKYDDWHYVDAERFFRLDQCGRWINGNGENQNVGFVGSENDETNSVVFDVETLQPVQAGDEFFLDYGPGYRI